MADIVLSLTGEQVAKGLIDSWGNSLDMRAEESQEGDAVKFILGFLSMMDECDHPGVRHAILARLAEGLPGA